MAPDYTRDKGNFLSEGVVDSDVTVNIYWKTE